MRILSFFLLTALFAVTAAGAERIVFQENFNSPDVLKKYRIFRQKDGVEFSVSDNALFVTHKNVPRSGFIEIPIPVIKKGRLDFDVLVNAKKSGASSGIGLTLDLYNISSFWHDACRDWRMYFPEPNAKRMLHYDIEPVGHHKIAKVVPTVEKHYRIRFDEEADVVEFFVDDMTDPAAARYDVSIFGHAFYQPAVLRIGSFGVAFNDYTTRIRNIVLTEEIPDNNTVPDKKLTLVFEGMTSEHYPVRNLLKEEPKQNIRQYVFDSPGCCDPNTNNYQYFKLPGFDTIAQAKYIIFNDAPNLDEALQKKILASVSDGAKLLIMGGFYTLHKGGFRNSRLGKELPVLLTDHVWNVAGSRETPMTLDAKTGKASVFYYLDLKPAPGAETGMSANKIPLLLKKKYGKGSITVFLGMISGPDAKDIFWKTPVLKEIFEYGLK